MNYALTETSRSTDYYPPPVALPKLLNDMAARTRKHIVSVPIHHVTVDRTPEYCDG